MKDNTLPTQTPPLLKAIFELLDAHRTAFRQVRSYRRAVALVFSELFSFGRHTLTQSLLALGITEGDWSAWYRLLSQPRFDEEQLAECLLQETLVYKHKGPSFYLVSATQRNRQWVLPVPIEDILT